MKPQQLIQKLTIIPKTYFSLSDIKKVYTGKQKNIPVILSRLVKKNALQKLYRGFYTLNQLTVDWETFACILKKPSYISLESGLYHHGLIDQIPESLTLVTTQKSQTVECHGKTIEYSHFKRELFFGYEVQDTILIATKEKALLDILYLMSLKKRRLTIRAEWLKKIDQKIFAKWLKIYPIYTQHYAQNHLIADK